MPEPIDLVDKLADSREIVHELLHDLTVNPVEPHEATLINLCVRVRSFIVSALRTAESMADVWGAGP